MKEEGFVYILRCSDGSYYTGSTTDLQRRLTQHQAGLGAIYTQKRLPVELVYVEQFLRVEDAFHREKQIQGWSRNKKEALMKGAFNQLPSLSRNYSEYGQKKKEKDEV